MITIVAFLFFLNTVLCHNCDEDGTIFALKKPIYDFSVRILDRVAFETEENFVYSPLRTWVQLISIAEGANSRTQKEVLDVTGIRGYRRNVCYRKKLRQILNNMDTNTSQMQTAIIVDKFYKVKKEFVAQVEALNNMKVLSLNFAKPVESAREANQIFEANFGDYFDEIVYPDDFDLGILMVADAAYFKSAWKYPFNEGQTKLAPFHNSDVEIGEVNMMNQVGYFNMVDIPLINARVIELPCADEAVSMLVFLPIEDNIQDLYYLLKDTSLTVVLNELKQNLKSVNVSIPRFSGTTEVSNVRELLYDMGIKRIFYPELAELKGVSDDTINVSLMTQLVSIEVTETHVLAFSGPESLQSDPAAVEFNANKPFGYMLVNRKTEIILFAGMYSEPSVY